MNYRRRFVVGYLIFAALALVITAFRGRNLPLQHDPVFGAIPGNDVFPYSRTNTIVAVSLLGAVGLIGMFVAARDYIKRRDVLPLIVMFSTAGLMFPEVAVDVIGKVYYPTSSSDDLITIFGRQMGMFLPIAFFGYGIFLFLTFKMLIRRPTTRTIWLILALGAGGAIVFEELLQWAGGMYEYYGNQPLRFLFLPQWWTPANTIGVAFLPAVIAYRFRDGLRGVRGLWMFVITPLSMMGVYGAICLPSWVVVNGDYSWLVTQLAGLATVGLGLVLAASIIRVLLQRDPFDLSEPIGFTDDPALDPHDVFLRRSVPADPALRNARSLTTDATNEHAAARPLVGEVEVTEPSATGNRPRPRCLLGMVGLDVHTKGIRTLSLLLRDRGVEVVYVGEHNSPEAIVAAAVAEDVDVIGLSFSTAGYLHQVAEVVRARDESDARHIALMVGGLVHPDDADALAALGVEATFGSDSRLDEIVLFLDERANRRVSA